MPCNPNARMLSLQKGPLYLINLVCMSEHEGEFAEVFEKRVEDLDMSMPAAAALEKLEINTIGDLVQNCSARRLREVAVDPIRADKLVDEIRDLFAEIGFTLREE